MRYDLIDFPNIEAMCRWMQGIEYEAGERGERVSFYVRRVDDVWQAGIV